MSTHTVKIPDATHPITIEPTRGRVVVRVGDTVIADSTRALSLAEASYPVVQYIPLADIDAAALRATDHHTYCPFKGAASYYSVRTPSGPVVNAGWTYEQPYEAVAAIAGHVAFYPDKVAVDVE